MARKKKEIVAPIARTGSYISFEVLHPDLWATFSKKQKTYLIGFSENLTIARTSQATGIPHAHHQKWLATDPRYYAAFEAMKELTTQCLEEEVLRRAMYGVDETIFHMGVPIGVKTNFSDTLAMFLLRARRPQVYRERTSVELTGKDGGPVTFAALDAIIDGVVLEGHAEEIPANTTSQELLEAGE